jgi:hypothetical protein
MGLQPASRPDSESPTLQDSPNSEVEVDSMTSIRESFLHLQLPEQVTKVRMANQHKKAIPYLDQQMVGLLSSQTD